MLETPEKKEEKTEKKDEKAPWNELLGKLLIKVAPVIVAGGVSGALPLIKGPALIATPNQFTVSLIDPIQQNIPTMRSPYQINSD
jgi:hypothetical protein